MVLSGLCAGLAGLLYAGRLHGARYTLGETDLLTVIAAVIVGGTRLNGGVGTIFGALIGSLLMGLLNNGLILMGLSVSEQLMVRGLILPRRDRADAARKAPLIEGRPRCSSTPSAAATRASSSRRSPSIRRGASRRTPIVIDLDAAEANARAIAARGEAAWAEGFRHDQADGAERRLLPGGRRAAASATRSASTWNAPAPRTAPGWRSAMSAISSRSRRPRRTLRRRSRRHYWTVFNAREGERSRRRGEEARSEPGAAGPHPGQGRPLLSRPRGRLRRRRCRRGRRPHRRTRRRSASPASRPSRRSSSIRRRGRSRRRRTLRRSTAPRRRWRAAGRQEHRDQRARARRRPPCSRRLAEAGATQVEPGHGLTGTTPLHAVEDLPELPAVVYVSEVSHLHGGEAYCFGGGLYIDPVFPDYPVKAIVSREPDRGRRRAPHGRDPAACGDRLLRHDRHSIRRPKPRSATPSSSASGRRPSSPAPIPRRLGPRRRTPVGRRRSMTRSAVRPTGRSEDGDAAAAATAPRPPPRRSSASSNIRKEFGGVVAIEDFSLDVHAGEVVALVGDNGAGKSTLIKIICGVYPPTAGRILIDGGGVRFADPADAQARGIQVVFQDLALAESQPVYMNLFLGRETVDRAVPPARPAAHDPRERGLMRASTSASLRRSRRIRDLSGGQRQGVAIARATHWASKLVLMDEPTAALGVAETAEGREHHPGPARAQSRGPDHQPQPRPGLPPLRPHLRASPRRSGRRPPNEARRPTTRSSR